MFLIEREGAGKGRIVRRPASMARWNRGVEYQRMSWPRRTSFAGDRQSGVHMAAENREEKFGQALILDVMRPLFLVSMLAIAFAGLAESDVPWSTGAKSPRIEALRRDPAGVSRFWEELKTQHTPLVEPIAGDPSHSLVTFVYRGTPDTRSVVLLCQMMTGRDPLTNTMTRLGDTDVWFKTYTVRNDMRLSYSFIPNRSPDAVAADALNPKAASPVGSVGRSVFELPDALPETYIAVRRGVRPGKLEEVSVESKILHAQRGGWVYTPAGFDRNRSEPYPLLICFDGQNYASDDYIPVPTIVDNLIADKKIPPLVVLLVEQSPQPNRSLELSNNPAFADFVADELLPHVREKWHATSNPAQTIVTGSSAGGLGAAFCAFRRPDVFGNVLSQSGAFWPGKQREDPDHEWLTRQYESSEKLPVRFVLQVGLLERFPTPGNGPSILDANRHLRAVLDRKGYEVRYREIAGGHEPLNWRSGLAEGLIQLLAVDRH